MSTAVNSAPAATGTTSYSMASLYVGDLHPEINESLLFEKFSAAGPVLSIRVCRDIITRRSLGYAYVNFQQPADAERALDTMNFDALQGKPIRIMWSQRDPATRRSGAGNIFIKNLDKVIDNKSIYDTFSLFGNILSCKVAIDEEGNSKGYGFVHFETEEAALHAIEKVNGMLLNGKKVFVGKFQPRNARLRDMGDSAQRFTNVFIKNLDESVDREGLEKIFGEFGTITSCAIMCDGDGKSRGFGFVAFEEPEHAEKAVNEMHEKELEGTEKKLFVCRAQKKSERQADLKRKYEFQKAERISRHQGGNLYVKNLDETVDDVKLRAEFEKYGTITSCKVMADENGRSKGFGFVCFEKNEDAAKAVTEMHSKIISTKPLYVVLAQRKEDRRAQLASLYMTRLRNLRMQDQVPTTLYTAGTGGYFVNSAMAQNRGGFIPAGLPTRMQGGQQKWVAGGGFAATAGAQSPYMVQGMQAGRGGRGPSAAGGVRPQGAGYPQTAGGVGRGGMAQQMRQPGQMTSAPAMGARGPAGPRPTGPGGMKPAGQAYGQQPYAAAAAQGHAAAQQQQQQRAPTQNVVVGGQEPLTSHMLAQAAPQEQKQLLGERIYSLIGKMYGDHMTSDVGKITGMMLEMDNSELIMMLNDEELFRNKVTEAAQVLKSAGTKAN